MNVCLIVKKGKVVKFPLWNNFNFHFTLLGPFFIRALSKKDRHPFFMDLDKSHQPTSVIVTFFFYLFHKARESMLYGR